MTICWRLPASSLRCIQRILLDHYGLPDWVIDQSFVDKSLKARARIGRKRQRAISSYPNGERKCTHCSDTERLERHHLISPMLGGRNVKINLIWLCRECHVAYHKEVQP